MCCIGPSSLHNPTISWPELHITSWGEACSAHRRDPEEPCQLKTTDATPKSAAIPGLPHEYQDLGVAFSKTKATELPPHCPCDCAIYLLPGATPPRGRIFPLSQPEAIAMTEYIQEDLKKGFICPSVSPVSSRRRKGGLRPCIDYRALNDITVKFRYPLPLVPSALEQLCRVRFFTKLDLRCAYNLIRIRQGDKWKTAFSTQSGHYEYLVMPFGLSNSPAVFQSFVNDVFRDMLDRWVIVYIEDILIYSENEEEHVKHHHRRAPHLNDEKCTYPPHLFTRGALCFQPAQGELHLGTYSPPP
ncbi:receptor-type tyrosine-protein phosphatase gamma-like [Tachysurus ichikawai]